MGFTSENKPEKQITMGILAHVDAGKTTLSEGILYTCKAIRKLGRVDHQDAFLDTNTLERNRGITIFSKQAECTLGEFGITLLDTPGHVDFSAEMERTLQVLDYGILVISGADGVQGHTETLWRLLSRYQIPVFLFINKMDQPGTDRETLLVELKEKLDTNCVDFSADQTSEDWKEQVAVCDEQVMEAYLEGEEISRVQIQKMVRERKLFPCYFGSALKLTGVKGFLEDLKLRIRESSYPESFGAKIYKITRDSQGERLSHMKITGGALKVKSVLSNGKPGESGEGIWQEKVNQIRIYSGEKYTMVSEVKAGTVCAVTGLTATYPGQGLGSEQASDMPVLEPVLSYRIGLPEEVNVHQALLQLRQLEEEEPLLHIVWNGTLGEIYAQVMGEVQIEILKSLIKERFGMTVTFDEGNIVYKETILEPVEGIGHFEPLRHYAEVHLLLEPGETGSGLTFATDCSEDVLDRNWQRLILTHLEEREHKGVLLGAPITDMKITLLTGRAHIKHTEGGDFRQATYRAVRQGLRKAKSQLLEPYYEFRLEVPSEQVGRSMTDIQKMLGEFDPPKTEGEMTVLTGSAPVVTMRDYQKEVISYTSGRGRLSCTLKGYYPCHNQEEVVEAVGYDPEADLENPTGSVFCAHGAGFVVNWDQVEEYMHVESGWNAPAGQETKPEKPVTAKNWKEENEKYLATEKELEEIFERTYGPIRKLGEEPPAGRSVKGWKKSRRDPLEGYGKSTSDYKQKKTPDGEKEYLLVDGYNIIFAWEDLKELAAVNIDGAREKLMDILCNYQGFKKSTLILVFDAYKVKGNPGSVETYHNIHVVYTKEAETADQYIEKTVHEIGRKYRVTVATSDQLEQVIILGQGGQRMSARELLEDVIEVSHQIRETARQKSSSEKNYLFDHLDEETAARMERIRLGEEEV
ncbi:MAG: translation factor GTPase family protein [Oliverpabstia intestinalis]|uniref:translation factor GTPase family protein n=1 Tax=Oliverpabstia sp. TaxID=2815798 RepID=UPI00258CBBE2|nr:MULTISPECIES: TetM/TetW/TetO/TetS family tetracycline resistance ribosomal protection protein [Oliverpabstia]MCF2541733.1 TetM/TetW/TetO/TetS family tetracycline resistance ribosomal protection protein [Blautia producta]MCI7525372.1 TetM/TetW/TetO/TetS family tetracycline resistance ribosomal protection protein [Oliverpabstia sp.]MDY5791830.1 translation factor GTPase family protein [Oliverpabstia intestinalis]